MHVLVEEAAGQYGVDAAASAVISTYACVTVAGKAANPSIAH
jgi:hypothetical protein